MAIVSRGYTGSSSSDTEPEFQLFSENIALLRNNEQKILETAEYFFCELPFASCSWPYVGGDGPLCLGYLLLGWKNGILLEPCSDCNGECLVFSFAGSPLSGSNSWSGFCHQCNQKKNNRDTVHKPFYSKILFVSDLRKRFPQRIQQWEEFKGSKFTFAGNGLEPAIQKRLKTIELFDSISLTELIHEISEDFERPKNDPESGFEAEVVGLKFNRC
jgi:hypothetical protein